MKTPTQLVPPEDLTAFPRAQDEPFEPGIAGFSFPDLFEPSRLRDLYEIFEAELRSADVVLASQYAAWRAGPEGLDGKLVSDILVQLAAHVSRFVTRLFRVDEASERLRAVVRSHDAIFRFKVDFLRRRALARFKKAADVDTSRLLHAEEVLASLRSHRQWPFPGPEDISALALFPVSVSRLSTSGTSIAPIARSSMRTAAPAYSPPEALAMGRDAERELALFVGLLLDAESSRKAAGDGPLGADRDAWVSVGLRRRIAAARKAFEASLRTGQANPSTHAGLARAPGAGGASVGAGPAADAGGGGNGGPGASVLGSSPVGGEDASALGGSPAGGQGAGALGGSPAGGAAAAVDSPTDARPAQDPGETGQPASVPPIDADTAFVTWMLDLLEVWCAARALDPARRKDVREWVSFRLPEPVHYDALVGLVRPQPEQMPELFVGPEERLRRRDGFALTDARMGRREVLSEVHYCVYCHERDKDSCSKGLRAKDGAFKKNPLGIVLQGCPLDEKISEAHMLEKQGDAIAALALVMLDNPMCPGTGHRICNDCMKGCIYQAQDPVNIPQIETGILTDVLRLPWGVEIYGFLTRWNPLNVRRPYTLPYNGKNVLVVGLGPAGYTLSHYLLNEGFGVIGIDGLKIEPLPVELTGDPDQDLPPGPVRAWDSLYRELDKRVLEGFGGVSEYGITVRWDKNFLTLLHLTLARRSKLRIFGGVRFGGTLCAEDAWEMGFDHIAIAAGAGKPTVIDMKNNLARGIRKASDFLMALQLTGAAKKDTLANLQARLPAIVVGGGLTAIDTATELAAYYPLQVEKTLLRYEEIASAAGGDRVWRALDQEETEILQEFLEHGRAVREERRRARAAGESPDFVKLVRSWGGVSLVYRKSLNDSPAYRLNHEEVIKSLEEGISYIECLDPEEALLDRWGAVYALRFRGQKDQNGSWSPTDRTVTLPARSVLVAAGTSPNVTYEKEHRGTFGLDSRGKFFLGHAALRGEDGRFHPALAKPGDRAFFTSYDKNGRLISFYGDNHPVYAGNVVKAMASAKDGFPRVAAIFADEVAALAPQDQPARERNFQRFAARLSSELTARVHRVNRLTSTIIEVVVKAPLAARKFRPGQFYRLQNYETSSALVHGTRLLMEGIALTGAWVDPDNGLLSLIVLEMGTSTRLCAMLQEGERVVVMGPTGAPTEIPEGQDVLLAGGGLGNAVLFSIARAMRAHGNRVVYFAGYKRGEDLFKREEIEAACDQIIWSTDSGHEITPTRPQDRHFRGNIVQAMKAYGDGLLGEQLVPLLSVDRIIAIGSDRMMNAVKEARRAVLAPYLKKDHIAIGSINSTMQCMMKEVCAQCLQKHVDPVTGAETAPVFSCFNQDQVLDEVDFQNLASRLRMNTVQEKLAGLWLDHILAKDAPQRV